ncbi:MAG: hypothetical protein WCG05_00580 [Alphaproteobacteria bacterium]
MYKILLSLLFISFSCYANPSEMPSIKPINSRIDNVVIPDQPRLDDVTIIVSSCDKYSEFWRPFGILLFRYWPSLKTYNKHIPIIIISNKKPFSFDRIHIFNTGEDYGWSKNMLMALAQVKTKYVLYMQEDYFLSDPVNEAYLYYLLTKMKEQDVPYIQLNSGKGESDYPAIKGTEIKGKYDSYRTSLQSALWNTKIFAWLIKEDEDAWAFERNATIRSQGVLNPFLALTAQNDPIKFLNAANSGYFVRATAPFLEKEGIVMKNTILPVYEDYKFTNWVRANFPRIFTFIWAPFFRLIDEKFRNKL